MGIGSLFGQDPPSPNAVPLDNGTRKIVNDLYANATDPNLGQKMTSGMEPTAQALLNSGKSVAQTAAGTGESPGMLEAIRNMYKNEAQGGIASIMRNSSHQIPFQRESMLGTSSASEMAMKNIENQNNEMMMQAQFNAEMARAQVLQGIFGAGGMLVGAKMAQKGPSNQTEFKTGSQTGLTPSGDHQYSNDFSKEML